MIRPLAEIVGLLQQGVGNLLRQAGLELMHLVMDEEVKSLAGDRHEQHAGRQAHRWGKEDGYCVVDGKEGPGSPDAIAHEGSAGTAAGKRRVVSAQRANASRLWDKMMRGLSTRNYGAVVKEFQQACGIEKSAVSENFIEANREKVKQLMERSLGELRLCAALN